MRGTDEPHVREAELLDQLLDARPLVAVSHEHELDRGLDPRHGLQQPRHVLLHADAADREQAERPVARVGPGWPLEEERGRHAVRDHRDAPGLDAVLVREEGRLLAGEHDHPGSAAQHRAEHVAVVGREDAAHAAGLVDVEVEVEDVATTSQTRGKPGHLGQEGLPEVRVHDRVARQAQQLQREARRDRRVRGLDATSPAHGQTPRALLARRALGPAGRRQHEDVPMLREQLGERLRDALDPSQMGRVEERDLDDEGARGRRGRGLPRQEGAPTPASSPLSTYRTSGRRAMCAKTRSSRSQSPFFSTSQL